MRLGEAESRRRSGLLRGRWLCCLCKEGGELFGAFASREKLKK